MRTGWCLELKVNLSPDRLVVSWKGCLPATWSSTQSSGDPPVLRQLNAQYLRTSSRWDFPSVLSCLRPPCGVRLVGLLQFISDWFTIAKITKLSLIGQVSFIFNLLPVGVWSFCVYSPLTFSEGNYATWIWRNYKKGNIGAYSCFCILNKRAKSITVSSKQEKAKTESHNIKSSIYTSINNNR